MELKEISKKITNGTATPREEDEFVRRLYEAGELQKDQFERYLNGRGSDKRFFLTLANFTYTFTKFVKSNNPQNHTTMEKERKLRKGQWASLETVKENIRRSGMDEKTVLEIASERVKWRIRRMITQLPDEDLMKLFAQLTNNQSLDS